MVPDEEHYGGWPRSGEIDIMESRGESYSRESAVIVSPQVSVTLRRPQVCVCNLMASTGVTPRSPLLIVKLQRPQELHRKLYR